MQTVQVTAYTERNPNPQPYAHSGSTLLGFAGVPRSRAMYKVAPTVAPRTLKALLSYALERLAPFSVVDLDTWNVEVRHDVDDGDYQVDFFNAAGARFCVDAIWMSPNKCGVIGDHGLSASID